MDKFQKSVSLLLSCLPIADSDVSTSLDPSHISTSQAVPVMSSNENWRSHWLSIAISSAPSSKMMIRHDATIVHVMESCHLMRLADAYIVLTIVQLSYWQMILPCWHLSLEPCTKFVNNIQCMNAVRLYLLWVKLWQEPNGDCEHQTSPLYWDGRDFADIVPAGHCSSEFVNGGRWSDDLQSFQSLV